MYSVLVRRANEMAFIAIVVILYVVSKVIDALEVFSVRISSFVNSDIGTVVIVALVAYLTYRWYKARQRATFALSRSGVRLPYAPQKP